MTTQRILVMGDNHGHADSLRRVVMETGGEEFDFIIHVGDITNAINTDAHDAGQRQLEAVAPHFEALAERGTLVYIWGNRDGYGDHVPEDVLTAGALLHEDTRVIDGQRFTTDPGDVANDTILLTHGEKPYLLDHFEGRAYFSGHEHVGRYKDRCLNSAFLYRDNSRGADPLLGGYFIIEVSDEPPFEVEFRNLGDLKRIVCHEHIDRGVLFQPHYHTCAFCHYDGKLEQEMLSTAYYGLTHDTDRGAVADEELVEYATSLFESPPANFSARFADYLDSIHQQPLARFKRTEDGRLTAY